jgi:HPt (histidine-containing phosphotransfer) domain-containing protein
VAQHPLEEKQKQIVGIDVEKLKKELMLTQEEILMLLELFIRKMDTILPELQAAIEKKEYKTIALKAHSIKGSSGNFRIEELLKLSSEMERMAKAQDVAYNYEKTFQLLQQRIAQICIV